MINVAVTGMNAGDAPAPGAPVTRCLREHSEWNGKVIGLGYDAFESGILDRLIVDSVYLLPYPSAGKEALLERIQSIHRKDRIDVIIPNLDSEIPNFIALEAEFASMGIRLFLPSEQQFKRRSKLHLPEFCKSAGIRTPATNIHVGPSGKVNCDGLRFPVVVKGVYYGAQIVHTAEAAAVEVAKLTATWGYPVLIQEYISGEEFNAAALGDGLGGLVGAVLMKKLVLTEKGKGWACVSIENESLMKVTKNVVARLKWKGPIEIEVIQSRSDGEFYMVELNPRFPAWIYLAKASGVNLPYALLELALGRTVSDLSRHRPGVVFSNYTTNLVMDLSSISSLFTCGELHHERTI